MHLRSSGTKPTPELSDPERILRKTRHRTNTMQNNQDLPPPVDNNGANNNGVANNQNLPPPNARDLRRQLRALRRMERVDIETESEGHVSNTETEVDPTVFPRRSTPS